MSLWLLVTRELSTVVALVALALVLVVPQQGKGSRLQSQSTHMLVFHTTTGHEPACPSATVVESLPNSQEETGQQRSDPAHYTPSSLQYRSVSSISGKFMHIITSTSAGVKTVGPKQVAMAAGLILFFSALAVTRVKWSSRNCVKQR